MNAIPDIFNNGNPPRELYFMTPIANVPSILERGILSHNRVHRVQHQDVSNNEVQERRAHKIVRNPARSAANKTDLTVHQHANLYLRAHNAMMSVIVTESDGMDAKGYPKSKSKRDSSGELVRDNLCVLRIDPRILCRGEVVVSTRNAARSEANDVVANLLNAKLSAFFLPRFAPSQACVLFCFHFSHRFHGRST